MQKWSGPLCGLAVGLAMLAWTWGTWPDVLVDFGGELYVPWRLSEGDVLYRDVAYFTGPLSPYLNGALFRTFGSSLRVLVLANLLVLAGIAALIHHLVRKIAGTLAAGVALSVFLALFAFAQLEAIGNSNYVCPYSHETTHGALLALAALAALGRWIETHRPAWMVALGFLLGLAFLTKVEVFLAAAGASLLGLAFGFAKDRSGVARSLGLLLVCAALPALAAFLALCTAMPATEALHGTLGAWPYTLDGRVADLAFYRWVLGTDRPAANFSKLLLAAGRWAMLCAPFAALAILVRTKSRPALLALAGAVAGAAVLLLVRPSPSSWIEAGRALPLFAGLLLLAFLVSRSALAAAFAAYALLLLLKMILHARINMYGFALAMPAAVLVVAALVGWIPAWIERRGSSGALFRGFGIGVLAVAVHAHLSMMQGYLARKTVVVGEGPDAFRADARGTFVNAALAALRTKLAPGRTLAALPEGVMLNFLARAKAPDRYINYMPPELIMFGEERILADLRANAPDLVAIVHKPTAEYGLPWFGVDYGKSVMDYIRDSYAPGPLYGGEPLRPETRFGIRLLQRRD